MDVHKRQIARQVLALAIAGWLASAAVFLASTAMAAGMQPETSVIILDEADGETSINIKNTDDRAALLYSSIENIPEDSEPLVILTPPIVRVEPGETQLVRFINQTQAPLKTQRLKRVLFEGIAQKKEGGRIRIAITIRQNLPLILHPKGLPRNREPWKLLKWSVADGQLSVENDSPYVVRMAQEVQLKPQGTQVDLPRTYILPGERLSAALRSPVAGVQSVTLYPATVYGYAVESYDAPLAGRQN